MESPTPSPHWQLRKPALDRHYGGLTLERIGQWILEGRVDAEDLVCTPQGTRWQRVDAVAELARLLGPAAAGGESLDAGTFGAAWPTRRTRRADPEVDITPFIDCTFLLLIFFVVTAQFNNQALQVDQPSAKNTTSHAQDKLVLVVRRDERLFLGAREVFLDRLAEALREEMLRTQQQSVVVKADREVRHGTFVKVLDRCKEAGLRSVLVGAIKEGE